VSESASAPIKFNFDRSFQISILGLIYQNFSFLVSANAIVKPEYFEDKCLIWFFQTMANFYDDYNTKMSEVVLREEILKAVRSGRIKDNEKDAYVEVFKKIRQRVSNEDYIRDQLVTFCRRQAVRQAIMDCAGMVNTSDDEVWGRIEEKVSSACSVGVNFDDVGTQYFKEIDERTRKRIWGGELPRIPVGISQLDNAIGGGLEAKQLGVWLGGTGRGKSLALAHCGKRAVVQGLKVVHITAELSAEVVASRYDASWSRVDFQELTHYATQIQQKVQKEYARYGNSLIIKEYPTKQASVKDIRAYLKRLEGMDFFPDLVIIDYGDELRPTTSYNDEYADLGNIFSEMRGLAGELKIPIWTATQTNRGGISSEIVDIEHIGDSIKKAQVADMVIAICMTREEKNADQARLFVAKNRNGPDKVEIPIDTAYNRMVFYSPCGPPPAPPGYVHKGDNE